MPSMVAQQIFIHVFITGEISSEYFFSFNLENHKFSLEKLVHSMDGRFVDGSIMFVSLQQLELPTFFH